MFTVVDPSSAAPVAQRSGSEASAPIRQRDPATQEWWCQPRSIGGGLIGIAGLWERFDVFIQGGFDKWQSRQSNRNFKLPYVVSLIQAGTPTRWLFAGLFRTMECVERVGEKPDYIYTLERVPAAEEWVGRLYLSSSYTKRNSYYPDPRLDARTTSLSNQDASKMSTQRFAKSQMDTFFPQAPAELQTECIVEISPQQLIVKYMDEGELVEYIGEVEGEGHYIIRGKGFEASGTLYLVGRRLEGSWKEGQQYGMWRIFLESED